jgi:GNAT superfamily N-acetyltransferase
MTRYAIEPAQPEHVPQLATIERAAARLFPPAVIPAQLGDEVVPVEVLAQAQEQGWLWVALDPGGSPVGFALARPTGEAVFLVEVDVHPEHGRKGLGRALVGAVVAQAQAEGYAAVTLTTFAHLPWNAPFYESVGFRRLQASEHSADLAGELAEEKRKGLTERVAMRLELRT